MRRIDRVTAAVVAVAIGGMILRVARLGARPFHWEEARIGYWTLRFADSGVYSYRPVAGGPLLYHLNEFVFSTLPPTDATARAVVVLIGGSLPVAALLFRSRLRGDETVALSLVLAFAPVLVYYSRFLRGDLPVAAFVLFSIGFSIRAVDSDNPRFLYTAGILAGLAVATSMQVFGYVVVLGAGLLLALDHRRVRDAAPLTAELVAERWARIDRWIGPIAGSFVVCAATVFLAYVPRGRDLRPAAAFEAGLVDPFRAAVGVFTTGRSGPEFLEAMSFVTESMGALGFPVLVAAILGLSVERYNTTHPPRILVQWMTFAAAIAFLLFPLANEVQGTWLLVHVVVLLSVPAAVGIARIIRFGRQSFTANDAASVAAALLVIVALLAPTGALLASAYVTPTDPSMDAADTSEGPATADRFAGFAQPSDDLESLVSLVNNRVDEGGSVVFVGGRFSVAEDRNLDSPPLDDREADSFAARLPVSWYLERAAVDPLSFSNPAGLDHVVETTGEQPAIVITTREDRDEVADRLDGYEVRVYRTALENREFVVFLR